MTALEQEVKDERTGEITVKPSLPGKLADEFCGYFDIVGRLYVTQEQDPETKKVVSRRRLLVQPTGKYVAKDRSDCLGVEIVDPTITKILDAIYGPIEEEAA